MGQPANGLEYLAQLREEYGIQTPNYQDVSSFLEAKAQKKGVPFSGIFELTPLCNLNCKMCYVHMMPEQFKGHSVLPVSVWKDLMHQAWEAGMFRATLSGGECLAYPGFEELYLYLHSLGCEVKILTNGLLLDDKQIQFFKEHRVADIQVTIYGWNDEVYERVTGKRAFESVSRNIRKAVEAGLPVRVSTTPSIYLGEDLLETIRVGKTLCRNMEFNSGLLVPREETGRSEQQDDVDLDLYIRAYRLINELNGKENREISPDLLPVPGGPSHDCSECGLNCSAGRSFFAIDWKGTMRACVRLDMVLGYPLEEGFTAAWKRMNQWATGFPKVPECDGCAYEEVCGNCVGDMLLYAEPGKQPKGLCERTKRMVQNGIWRIPECE
ncbi:radical SAM protein [Clostridiales bacterium]|nr:radical SAM protein [Clostridiales bacterium]